MYFVSFFFFFFQAEDGIRDYKVTGVQTCALPICAQTKRRRGKSLGSFHVVVSSEHDGEGGETRGVFRVLLAVDPAAELDAALGRLARSGGPLLASSPESLDQHQRRFRDVRRLSASGLLLLLDVPARQRLALRVG